nr:MAG TPA: hypothetical protein [Caudoviricetes sp.]
MVFGVFLLPKILLSFVIRRHHLLASVVYESNFRYIERQLIL